jgi:uncharacterized membrane protein
MALEDALPQSSAPPTKTESLKLVAGQRIDAIDVLRGLVIVIMALDHIRDYLHISGYAVNPLNPEQTTPLLYMTRWITHFCAPTFVFLSGVSAFLQGARGKSKAQLARHLFTRGLWLVVLEMTVISFGWAWSVPYMMFLQVFWAIGVSMMILSLLVWLPADAVLAIGVAIIAGHNLFDGVGPEALGPFGLLWQLAHGVTFLPSPQSPAVFVLYSFMPWFGVMALGYGLGQVFLSERRDRTLPLIGGAMVLAFLALRGFNLYGNPLPWTAQADLGATLMAFFDVSKYPPSLLYVCATLGPVLLLFPLLAKLKGPVADILRTYGAVPLMAYIAHQYVVHAIGVVSRAATGQDTSGLFNAIYNLLLNGGQAQQGISFPLWYVYLAWIAVLIVIYPVCLWWADVKRRRREWWLSYL